MKLTINEQRCFLVAIHPMKALRLSGVVTGLIGLVAYFALFDVIQLRNELHQETATGVDRWTLPDSFFPRILPEIYQNEFSFKFEKETTDFLVRRSGKIYLNKDDHPQTGLFYATPALFKDRVIIYRHILC